MSKKQQMTLSLDDDAAEILKGAVSNRKRGEFLSDLLRNWKLNKENPPREGILEEVVKRLDRIETAVRHD
ncbi:MAG: hypothetical protein KDE46_07230 [Caldilineaceae bacterium]|nr:hypothetical protein [Caldilineaceae bacterium]